MKILLRLNSQIGLWTVALAMVSVLLSPARIQASPGSSDANICYAVADSHVDGQGATRGGDTLVYLYRDTGATQPANNTFGNTGTSDIEAIAFRPGGIQLYAADGGRLGILDLELGTFTAISGSLGIGTGQQDGDVELETQEFNDVDSLSFHPITGQLWGVNRNPGPDVLFQIDAATGQFVPGAFADPNNPGGRVDFVQVQPMEGVSDVDDIAIDPVDGTMYASMNSSGRSSKLVIIDPADGSTTAVGSVRRASTGTIVADIEGLGFANDGQLYGSVGSIVSSQPNTLWHIDKSTAVATLIGEFHGRVSDVEGLDCLTSAGYVALEKSTNGVDADLPGDAVVVRAGDPITWTYLVRNTGAVHLTEVTVTDDNATPDNEGDDFVVCGGFALAPGQSNEDTAVACQATGTAVSGQYVGWAEAVAQDAGGNQYSSQDASHYLAYTGAAVGDWVWHDTDGNGLQDAFEADAGVGGVEVNLYTASDELVTITQTSKGFYLFDDLVPGDYYLTFSLPSGFGFTETGKGSDDALDSDVVADPDSPTQGRTAEFSLADGEIDLSWDAGLIGESAPASLSGMVWEDLNGDGVQNDGNPDEIGVADAQIALHAAVEPGSTQVVAATTTAADGTYSLPDLAAGDYHLEFVLPDAYDGYTLWNQGISEALDSDADPATGRTPLIALAPGQADDRWDAGLVRGVGVGGTVWEDTNEDGLQNDGDTGIGGLSLILYSAAGKILNTTTSAADGSYWFAGHENGELLPPGQYRIGLPNLPAGLAYTQPNVGNDDEDSDIDPDSGLTALFTILSGGEDRSQDVGLYWSELGLYLPVIHR